MLVTEVTVHSHQAPTLIGCLIVKERYCQILYYLLHLAANFALRRLRDVAASAAEKRDYEGVFSACQIVVAFV